MTDFTWPKLAMLSNHFIWHPFTLAEAYVSFKQYGLCERKAPTLHQIKSNEKKIVFTALDANQYLRSLHLTTSHSLTFIPIRWNRNWKKNHHRTVSVACVCVYTCCCSKTHSLSTSVFNWNLGTRSMVISPPAEKYYFCYCFVHRQPHYQFRTVSGTRELCSWKWI